LKTAPLRFYFVEERAELVLADFYDGQTLVVLVRRPG
jgi:hypothetical protein